MKLEYGPPPQAGVQSLQYLSASDSEPDYTSMGIIGGGGMGGTVRLVGAGLALYGWSKKDKQLTRYGAAAVVLSLFL